MPAATRSFAPKGTARVKRDPLPEHPTNGDLGRAIMQVEECAHTIGARHEKALKALTSRLSKIEKQNVGVRKVVGVDDQGNVIRKTPMLMSQLGFFSTLSGVVFGLFLVVQLGNAVWPSVHLMAGELWRFALAYGAPSAPH